jgi:hypothetical protein
VNDTVWLTLYITQNKALVTILQNNDEEMTLVCCKESKEKERKANRFQQKEEPAKQLYNNQ